MKIFLTLFVLFFSSSVLTDDISDFEIEGFSIGDDLLNHFTEEEIISNVNFEKNLSYDSFSINPTNSNLYTFKLSDFDAIGITYESPEGHGSLLKLKNSKKKYTIESIRAVIEFPNNIDQCMILKKEIEVDINNLLNNADLENKTINHESDKTGNSKVYQSIFFIDYYSLVKVECYDWTEEMGYMDHLSLILYSKDYIDWILEK